MLRLKRISFLTEHINMKDAFVLFVLVIFTSVLTQHSEAFNRNLTGFKGEAVNFTWNFPKHPIDRIYFGLWENEDSGYNRLSLITVKQTDQGIVIYQNTGQFKAKPYIGRVRWVGDVDQGLAVFELSGIQESDNDKYGFEVDYKGHGPSFPGNWSRLIVKPPSKFTFGPKTIYSTNGGLAEFSWGYFLNNDDRASLSSIQFGSYKHGHFKELCSIEVANELVKSKNCLTNVLDPMGNITFIRSNIGLNDEGVYEIKLTGTLRMMSNKSTLIVYDPPKLTKQPRSVVATENHMFNLTCEAAGKPRPNITWKRGEVTVQASFKTTYIVNQTRREDTGKYRCIASNAAGRVQSSTVDVDVLYAPRINSTNDVIMIPVLLGESKWLKCPVKAHPRANLEWYSNGQLEQHNGENIQIKISQVQDYRNYTCLAKNIVGSTNVTFVLKKVGPPSVPKVSCDKREDTSNSLIQKLHWITPKNDGGSPVIGYTVKYRMLRGHTYKGAWNNANVSNTETWYKLQLVDWDMTFELTVTAWNEYGESKLDLEHSSCVIVIGKDPSVRATSITTSEIVIAAAAKKDSASSDNITAYVIPGVVGLIALIAIIAVFVTRRRHHKRHRVRTNWTDHHLSFNALNQILDPSISNPDAMRLGVRSQTMVGSPSYQMDPEWTIPRERICVLKVIGNGAFGLVYKGRVQGVGSGSGSWKIVAIKSPYADATDSEVRDLMKEFELLKTLKPHPHVIRLLGCGEGDGRPMVIIEYVPFGDLLGYLRKSRGENDEYYSDPEIKPNTNLSSQQLVRFGWNIADGMAYLASQKIIHRDLAARNVLVGEGLACKITDFGMAKDVSNDDIYVRTTEGRLPVKWTAIEALTGSGEYTTQSDVWSFGVVLYEICTIGSDPYPGITGKEIPERLEKGYRMSRPGHVDTVIYEIMLSCWEKEPDERPTFPELKEKLVNLEDAQCKDYINLSECLYQNVQTSRDSNGACGIASSSTTRKYLAKENDYHKGPKLNQSSNTEN